MVDGRMFDLKRERADVQQPQRRVATGKGQKRDSRRRVQETFCAQGWSRTRAERAGGIAGRLG